MLLLLAALVLSVPDAPILVIPPAEWVFDPDRGYMGGRAMVADDGRALVVECGDGRILAWREGQPVRRTDAVRLFRAAQAEGIIDPRIRCPSPAIIADDPLPEPDCLLLDHDDSRQIWVLSSDVSHFVVGQDGVLLEPDSSDRPGVLLPRGSEPTMLAVAGGEGRPERLRLLPLAGGEATELAVLPNPNLVFEDGEGLVHHVHHAAAPDLLLLAFGGVFRVAERMTLLRAYMLSGQETWRIERPLPARDESLIVGDNALLALFDGGRRLVLGRTSDRSRSELIDAATGGVLATMPGAPVAAARDAARVLMRQPDGTLALVAP